MCLPFSRKMSFAALGLLLLVALAPLANGQLAQRRVPVKPPAQPTPPAPAPRYVFLFIGDGMGFAQLTLGERAAAAADQSFRMNALPVKGSLHTRSADAEVTDSASAATALACCVKTNNGMIGMTPDEMHVPSLAQYFSQADWKVGILSSVQVNHATPAAFYGHVKSRNMYNEIAEQFPASGINILAGRSMNSPDKSQDRIMEAWRKAGITVAQSFADADKAPALARLVLLADTIGDPDAPKGNLADAVTLAIDRLDDDGRFFMMVEGGAIDWAGHANQAWENTRETLAFDRAIDVAYRFYQAHPEETLIVVTADHETGGLRVDVDKLDFDRLRDAKATSEAVRKALGDDPEVVTFATLEAALAETAQVKDLTDAEKAALTKAAEHEAKGRLNVIERAVRTLIDARAGVTWSTGGHTGQDVPVMAVGAGAERFAGPFDNTEIPRKILKLALPDLDLPVAQEPESPDAEPEQPEEPGVKHSIQF